MNDKKKYIKFFHFIIFFNFQKKAEAGKFMENSMNEVFEINFVMKLNVKANRNLNFELIIRHIKNLKMRDIDSMLNHFENFRIMRFIKAHYSLT